MQVHLRTLPDNLFRGFATFRELKAQIDAARSSTCACAPRPTSPPR